MKQLLYFFLLIISLPIAAQQQRKLDSLKAVLKKLPAEGRTFGGDTMRVRVLCEMGKSRGIGQENLAIPEIKLSILIADRINWIKGQYEGNFQLGFLYASSYEYLRAIEYLYKSLLSSEKASNKLYIAKNCRILGDCYSTLGDYEKAKVYLKRSLESYFDLKLYEDYLISLNNLGLVYYESKYYKKAATYFLDCIEKNKSYKFNRRNTHFLTNLGATYIHLSDYENALKYLTEAKNLQNQLQNYPSYHKVLTNTYIAECWFRLKNNGLALTFLKKAEKLNTEGGSIGSSKSLYDIYYQVYKEMGEKDLALSYYEKLVKTEESLKKQDFDRQLKNVQYEYENGKKIIEISLLNQKIKQEKLYSKIYFGGLIFLFLFGLWFWWNNRQLSLKNKQIQQQQLEIKYINSELENLNSNLELKVHERTQQLSNANEELLQKNVEILTALVEGQTIERKRVATELHDNLGSMLSSMKFRLQALNKENLTQKEQKIYDGILSMMDDTYSEVRLLSHNLLPAEFEKSGLIGALEKLCNDINQSEKLYILLNTNGLALTLDKKTELELYSICLELVNNILKHSEATEAKINFKKENNSLKVEISDNGKGIDENEQKNGIGLQNIRNRMKVLSGNIDFFQNSTQNGTAILLDLPHYYGLKQEVQI